VTDPGYITDVEYTGGYYAQLDPAMMTYIAALNRHAARPNTRKFTYCELGCGKGVSSVVHAALHPGGEFYGFDLNAAHIQYATELAAAGEVRNVKFFKRTFAQMMQDKLPEFDFITLHGVLTWVSEPVRGEIRALIRKRLKPGGLVMMSYNVLPGWSHIQPLRKMMQSFAHEQPGDSKEKARHAYAHVKFLADNNAKFFAVNPAALQQVRQMGSLDLRYIAHEYITPHGDALYFSAVAESMGEIGLNYLGSMVPEQNYPSLTFSGPFMDLAQKAPSKIIREIYRDFVGNTQFRYDLYVRPVKETLREPEDPIFGGVCFRLSLPPEQLPLEAEIQGIKFNFLSRADQVRAVHELLGIGPADGRTIHQRAGTANEQETLSLIQDMVLARHLAPCGTVDLSAHVGRLNLALIDCAIKERQGGVGLVCPDTRSVQNYEISQAMAITSISGSGDTEAHARALLARLRACGMAPMRTNQDQAGVPVTEEEETERLRGICSALRDASHPATRAMRFYGLL
jgi:2-polyprenyl-3-methyl-5-hydroxy-6-metoxy-1,4-benzoquinol methylase